MGPFSRFLSISLNPLHKGLKIAISVQRLWLAGCRRRISKRGRDVAENTLAGNKVRLHHWTRLLFMRLQHASGRRRTRFRTTHNTTRNDIRIAKNDLNVFSPRGEGEVKNAYSTPARPCTWVVWAKTH
ncbi:hypothetical protein EVAR_21071_1 [Eumeta japonica]|uniref:Uncharacterized protein n=1 Tax=Eumeta variegata TaxID=151549 RepID=A0A4C1V183_EUMVA|nr:hypothetical protein EVAR_21071_1 [Eumeta japonica]